MITITIVVFVISIILLILGIKYPLYNFCDEFYGNLDNKSLHKIKAYILFIEKKIAPSIKSNIYFLISKFINKVDLQITVERVWLYKISSCLVTFILLVAITFTNTNILKEDIMGLWWKDNYFLESISPVEYKYNANLYKEVVKKIGEKNLVGYSKQEKVNAVAKILKSFKNENGKIGEMAIALVNAYDNTGSIRIFTINIFLISIAAFFLPETSLLLRKLIVMKKYKREAVKMQNILGLLGTIDNYKTINILKDMASASNIFNRQFNHASTLFYTDKNKCFEYMKKAIKDSSFNKLTDILRIYSTVDKKLAMLVLERNLKEQEEQLLLSAEEDMDLVDILAFISIVPILYEIANLMLNPMLDIVFQAFNFM